MSDAGAPFVGEIAGGGGTFELSGGSGHISGLGGAGQLFGSGSAGFAGFAAYVVDAGGEWALTASNALSASESFDVSGAIDVSGSLVTAAGPTVNIAASGSMTFTGSDETLSGTLVNAGVLETKRSPVVIANLAQGSGGAVVINGGTLDLRSVLDQAVTFKGSSGALELAKSLGEPVDVAGFKANGQQSLDLGDIAFIGADEATFSGTVSGGVPTVTAGNHVARINLVGNYTHATFIASDDGAAGTDVVAVSAQTPSVAHFIGAMAAITGHGGSAGLIDARSVHEGRQMMLAAPRLALA
jgi:hypothetical protein